MGFVVVTEGQSDVDLLRAILNVGQDNREIRFMAAGRWSAADSYARSVLMVNQADVAIVVDADATDPDVVEERKRFLHYSLGSVSPRPRRYHVTVIAPDIEYLLFRDRDRLEQLVGRPVSETDMVRASFGSRVVLSALLGTHRSSDDLAERLRAIDWSFLRSDPDLGGLIRFLGLNGRVGALPERAHVGSADSR